MNWNGCGAPAYRREINRQLNKGEAFHALRQRIYFGQHGKIRRADPDAQAVQANALNLVTAAVTCWNTIWFCLAEVVDQLRQEGWQVTDDQLAHLSPTTSTPTGLPLRPHTPHRTPAPAKAAVVSTPDRKRPPHFQETPK